MNSEWTPEKITALITAVSAAIIGIFSKQVVDSIMTVANWYRAGADKRDAARALDSELNEKGHKWIIRRQDRRITELEKMLEELRDEHLHCREEYAALKMDSDRLARRLEVLEKTSPKGPT